MGAEESDCQHACLILYARNQSVIVALDVEHHSAALENAGFWIRRLYILGGEVALDDLGTDDEHLLKYGTDFQKLEDGHSLRAIVVAAELRYGSTKKNSSRLTAQLEAVLGAIEVLALEAPVDAAYGVIRTSLARTGQPIGANDLLIATHALTLGLRVVTDNEREFLRIDDLRVENCLR